MLHIIIIMVVNEYVCTGIEMTHISNQRWIALFECKVDDIHTKIYQLLKNMGMRFVWNMRPVGVMLLTMKSIVYTKTQFSSNQSLMSNKL